MTQRPRRLAPRGSTLADRLAFHTTEAPSGCHVWTGCRSEAGYGRIQHEGTTLYAHRVSYELAVGPIPAGKQIDHLCRRPWCVKPAHLQAVDPQTNVLRGTSPGARAVRNQACRSGHPRSEYGFHNAGRWYCRECQRVRWQTYVRPSRRSVGVERTA